MARKSISRHLGVGSGLIPRDLNKRVRSRLSGLSDTPEEDIVALLESTEPLESGTRLMLADAICGRSTGIAMAIRNATTSSKARQLFRNLARLQHGKQAEHWIKELGYDDAVEELARAMGKDTSSAKNCITLARAVSRWIVTVRENMPEHSCLGDHALELAFIYAKVQKVSPEEAIKPSLPYLSKLILGLQQEQDRALVANEWFLT